MSLGTRADTISLSVLLEEVKTAAVEKQSEMLNHVRLMKENQERDETVKKFLARLKGMGAICKLAVTCTCNEVNSYLEEIITTTLVKGLVDNETKGEILSKVKPLMLDETIVFLQAGETGQRYLAGLGNSGTGLAGQKFEHPHCIVLA